MDLSTYPSFNFKINNEDWKIYDLTQEKIKECQRERNKKGLADDPDEQGIIYGVTYIDKQIILIDKDLPLQRKRKTLIHELTHCFISTTISHLEMKYDEEFVADIVANSFDSISDVVGKYFF